MNGKLTILVCILVAGVIVGASLPIFDSLTASSDSIHNDGAGWVRFDLNRSADASYNINVSWDDDGYYIANGSNVQTFDDSTTEDFSTIIYADSNVSVWTFDGDSIYMLGAVEGAPVMATFTDPVSIARDSAGVVISDGTDSYTFGAPAWAYVPQSSGAYGFFNYDEERGVKNPTGTPTAVIGGGNVGVYAYNDIYTYDGLGLTMHPIIGEDSLYYGAEWYRDIAPFDPEGITINPLDPSVINPGDSTQPVTPIYPDPGIIDIIDPFAPPSAELMAIPTPTYTDGVWGYDLMTVDGVTYAKIVSYSGTGDPNTDITVPATVGGYAVHTFGKDDYYNNVFNTSLECKDLIFSDGIKKIGKYACQNCSKFTGSLVIPDSVTWIGDYAFSGCKFAGTLTLPSVMDRIDIQAFRGCPFTGTLTLPTGLTVISSYMFSGPHFTGSLVIPEGVTSIEAYAFDKCIYMTGTLTLPSTLVSIGQASFNSGKFTGTLVIPDSVTSIDDSSFIECRNFTKVIISNSVTSIPKNCFYNCYNLDSVVIGDSVTSIGNSAFYGCEKITKSIIIPDSVTSIDNNAFQYTGRNSYIKDLVFIPDSVTSIGTNAFQGSWSNYLIIASDAIPGNSTAFQNSARSEVLDLSNTVDYSVDRYGINANTTVYDSIGDCFGYIAVVDLEGEGNGTIGDLIALLPVIMLAGIVLFSIVALAINRS